MDVEVSVAETPTFTLIINDEPRGVDLRELHRELGSRRDFSNWAKASLAQFAKGEHFVINITSGANSGRGRPPVDYAVSVECAKHIAMMEQTEWGRQVRAYFIECEKDIEVQHAEPTTYLEAMRARMVYLEKNEEQDRLLEVRRRGIPE